MRGNPCRRCSPHCGLGSIPAYAGEPAKRCSNAKPAWVYPRVCGGTSAGGGRLLWHRVYPRVCGGTAMNPPARCGRPGLSPRMRGNRLGNGGERCACMSIPAYAGEPETPDPVVVTSAVYPRVCGGTYHRPRHMNLLAGLSPRMRGNRGVKRKCECHPRSIPAYAGEPGCTNPFRAA